MSGATRIVAELREELEAAEAKAWQALARYKFQMFGYWAAIWVHLNRIGGFRRPNPWAELVGVARRDRREYLAPAPLFEPPAACAHAEEGSVIDYQAFAYVITPDYAYWNPVPGTQAACEAQCRALAEDYAFAAPRYPPWRAERFLRELDIRPAPRLAISPEPSG